MSDKYEKRRVLGSSVTTVVSLSLVLFMLGLLGLLILNTRKLSDHVKESITFQVIIKDNINETEVAKLQKQLETAAFSKSAQYISKDAAATKLKEDLGEDFISFIGYNPLLSSFNVGLKAEYASADSLEWIEKKIMQNKNVKEVVYQKSLIATVDENVKKISVVIFAVSIVLMIIALALINNTIRLSIYSQRFTIKTMQLVGATQGFIRKPFIFKGIRHGVYGSLIAIAMIFAIVYTAEKHFPELVTLHDVQLLATLFGIVLLLGMLIGAISTSLAVRKYLRSSSDELYY